MSSGCSNDTPPNDPRCDDPAFREANPDLCKLHPQLILQPAYALTEPGSNVEYVVLLRANGVETQITLGLTWFSSNVGAATINEDGVATGVTPGQTSISVTWQDISAQAQLDVVGSCADTHQNFLILIDNSKSMGQAFSSTYATKLAFSKSIAADFVSTINFAKDQVAVAKFADDFGLLQPWTDDATTARAAVNSIALAQEKTDLYNALNAGIESFEGQTGIRVIVLFTDGEWSGEDPKPLARQFRESGGFLVIVATRAWGDFFVDLLEMASSGFLFSAYGATESNALNVLSGLKSFLCSGNCFPEAGTAPTAQLNYDGFINWNVTAGRVDLIGLGKWDVRPGHGLYVDLQGTGSEGPAPGEDFGLGQLTSKVDYDFEDGKDYKFEIEVGGSLNGPASKTTGTWTIRIRAGDQLDEEVTITAGNLPFLPYVFEWTQVGDYSGPIIIEQTVQTGHHNVGTCIDEIKLTNVTDDEVMLYDNFDTENPVTVEPPPGTTYSGCLEAPPGSQSADLQPPTPRVVE